MNGERSDGLGRALRAVTVRRIGFTLLGLAFLGFWGLLFGSGLRTHLAAGNTLMAAYTGAWMISPLAPVGLLVANRLGRAQRLFRGLSVGVYAALLGVYWAYVWGHSLVDQIGSLPMTVYQGVLLVAPLVLVAALYMAMGASTPDIAPSSGSSSG